MAGSNTLAGCSDDEVREAYEQLGQRRDRVLDGARKEKAEAAREFHRVAKSGGRVSLFEPINSRNLLLSQAVDFSPLGHLGDRLRTWNEAFYANPDDPMIDFDEKDLEHFFLDAGFIDVRLEFGADEHQVQGDRFLTLRNRNIPVRYPYVFLTASKP
jgi:hypothetical protein